MTFTDILTQWEKLYALAMEQQSQSSELSAMNKCLEEMEAELSNCEDGYKAFSSLRDVENCLISTKVTFRDSNYECIDFCFDFEIPRIMVQCIVNSTCTRVREEIISLL